MRLEQGVIADISYKPDYCEALTLVGEKINRMAWIIRDFFMNH